LIYKEDRWRDALANKQDLRKILKLAKG
jgi:hypothetical protein